MNINFEEILKKEFTIIGPFTNYNDKEISFTTYSDQIPYEKEITEIDNHKFLCTEIIDVTDDDEREEGLSYSKINFIIL